MIATDEHNEILEGLRGRIRHWKCALFELEPLQEKLREMHAQHGPLLDECRATAQVERATEAILVAIERIRRALDRDEGCLNAEIADSL